MSVAVHTAHLSWHASRQGRTKCTLFHRSPVAHKSPKKLISALFMHASLAELPTNMDMQADLQRKIEHFRDGSIPGRLVPGGNDGGVIHSPLLHIKRSKKRLKKTAKKLFNTPHLTTYISIHYQVILIC